MKLHALAARLFALFVGLWIAGSVASVQAGPLPGLEKRVAAQFQPALPEDLYGQPIASVRFRGNRRVESEAMMLELDSSPGELVTRPKLLLMDEPFSALDATTRASLHGHLLALWVESRPTVVMVTHDVEEAVTLADRIVVMQPKPGRIFDEFDNPLARPRDRLSPAFEAAKREVLRSLDRSLRDEAPHQQKAAETAGMWW